jgi:hypothetical protein
MLPNRKTHERKKIFAGKRKERKHQNKNRKKNKEKLIIKDEFITSCFPQLAIRSLSLDPIVYSS